MQVSVHTNDNRTPTIRDASATGHPDVIWLRVGHDLVIHFESLEKIEEFAAQILIQVEDRQRAADGVSEKDRKLVSEKTLHIARETSIQV